MHILLIENCDVSSIQCNYYYDFYKALQLNHNVTLKKNVWKFNHENTKNIDIIIFGFSVTECNCKFPTIVNNSNVHIICVINKEYKDLQQKLNWIKHFKPSFILTVHHDYEHYEKITTIPCKRIMWSSFYKPIIIDKKYDLFFSGVVRKEQTDDWRTKIYNNLDKLSNLNVKFNGSLYPQEKPKYFSEKDYIQFLNQSKICVSTTGPADLVGTRYFEIFATKSLLICNRMKNPEVYKDICIENFNCIMFSSIDEFIEKVNYYATHNVERNNIIENAYKYFHDHLTWKCKIENLFQQINI